MISMFHGGPAARPGRAAIASTCAMLITLGGWVLGANTALAALAPTAATLERMDDMIAARMAPNGVPGFAVAVVSGGEVVHARGFGVADDAGRRVTADTPFLLASSTKSFTALAVMQLVDAGKVRLDAPIRRYVPEFSLAGNSAERITVRQVLQHTSGLPANVAGGPIIKLAGDGTPRQALAELRGKAPASAPGEKMLYVNANYVLSGLLVEHVSGERYASYVSRHIFAPLGMTHSFSAPGPARRDGLAAGHDYIFGLTRTTGPAFRRGMLAAGYLMSSANDMARYLAVFLNDGVGSDGRRIVSAQGLRTLLSGGRPVTHLGPWADSAPSHYAMGWFDGGPWKEPAILHPGDAADSSSLMVLFPSRDVAVVTLANTSNELPVPGNPAAITRMQRNAVDVLLGEPVNRGTSVHRFYFWFDVVAALLLAAALLGLARAVLALRGRLAPHHRVRAIIGIPGRIVLAAVVLGYPALIGVGWTALRSWHTDLALTLVIIGAVILSTALVRLVWLLRTRPRAVLAPPPPDPARPAVRDAQLVA
jgi:CubicO group peptidase (beta-lactamase class C family)